MEPFATTAVYENDGTLTVYDKTQGVQNVQRLPLQACSALADDEVRVVSPLSAGRSVRGSGRNTRCSWPSWRRGS